MGNPADCPDFGSWVFTDIPAAGASDPPPAIGNPEFGR